MIGLGQTLFGTNVPAAPGQLGIAHRPRRPELGPRITGPGFNLRWIRRPFYFGTVANGPTWIESTDPARDYARHFLPIDQIARDCIQHDRLATLHRETGRRSIGNAKVIARFPSMFRHALRVAALVRIQEARYAKPSAIPRTTIDHEDGKPGRAVFHDHYTGAILRVGTE